MAANNTLNTRIVHKNDIEANWIKATRFTPLEGEIIIYRAEKEGDALPKDSTEQLIRDTYITYSRIKIGDGKTNVNDLPFVTDAILDLVAQAQKFYAKDDGNGIVTFVVMSLEDASLGVY